MSQPIQDIEVQPDKTGELMVTGINGLTEAGEEFVDRYVPPHGLMVAVDAGRIVIRETDLDDLIARATSEGLTVAR